MLKKNVFKIRNILNEYLFFVPFFVSGGAHQVAQHVQRRLAAQHGQLRDGRGEFAHTTSSPKLVSRITLNLTAGKIILYRR